MTATTSTAKSSAAEGSGVSGFVDGKPVWSADDGLDVTNRVDDKGFLGYESPAAS